MEIKPSLPSPEPVTRPPEQFVVFATPALDHNVTLGYFESAYNTIMELDRRGIAHAFFMLGGDPYLAKVRNLLVHHALKSYPAMTDFFFIDADMRWDPKGVVALLDAPFDVVAGVYPKKNDVLEFPAELDYSGDRLTEMGGFYKAVHIPTGFLRIKRHVLERMYDAEKSIYDDATGNAKDVRNIFEMGFAPDPQTPGKGKWWGEDYAWSEKWRAMGGEIWVYPDIMFGHRGGKTWNANYVESVNAFLEGRAKVVDIGTAKENAA